MPASTLEWLLEALTLGILLFWLYHLTLYRDTLPDGVPRGFNFAGQPRGSASKLALWLLPSIGIIIYGSLTLLSRFPHLHNFPVEVKAANAKKLYGISRLVLQLLKFELIACFGYIEWKMLQTARGNAEGLGPWFVPLLLAVVFTTSLYPMLRMRRDTAG